MDRNGELTDADIRDVAARTGVPEATVHGVSTFYDDLVTARGRRHVRVCTGTACFAATGGAHVDELRAGLGLELGERSADGELSLGETVCLGFCHSSPAVRDGALIDAGEGVVDRVLAGAAREAREPAARSVLEEPVLTSAGDWAGLRRALAELSPGELLEEVKAADLRGRGGAAFPAGTKWEFARDVPAPEKFIVANGDEGDPGSYIDKHLMERAPDLLLEGMALAGYAVGAAHGFVLTRSEYPRSKPALQAAAARARDRGLLGEDILGSGFAFDVTIVEGAGLLRRGGGDRAARLPAGPARRGVGAPAVPGAGGRVRDADRRQQRRDAVQRRVHRGQRCRRLPRAQPGCERRLQARLLQRALRAARRRRGAVRPVGCASCARRSPAASSTVTRSRRCRSAGRSPGSCRRRCSTRVRLRRARRAGLHGRPRQHRRVRRDAPTCATSPATCCGSARTRAAESASPAASACSAPTRCSRCQSRSTSAAPRGTARGARARQPVRTRKRDAGADPQPDQALSRRAGSVADAPHHRRPRGRGRRGHDRARGGAGRRPARFRRSASTSAWRRSARAGSASSGRRARPGRFRRAPRAAGRAW